MNIFQHFGTMDKYIHKFQNILLKPIHRACPCKLVFGSLSTDLGVGLRVKSCEPISMENEVSGQFLTYFAMMMVFAQLKSSFNYEKWNIQTISDKMRAHTLVQRESCVLQIFHRKSHQMQAGFETMSYHLTIRAGKGLTHSPNYEVMCWCHYKLVFKACETVPAPTCHIENENAMFLAVRRIIDFFERRNRKKKKIQRCIFAFNHWCQVHARFLPPQEFYCFYVAAKYSKYGEDALKLLATLPMKIFRARASVTSNVTREIVPYGTQTRSDLRRVK